MFRATRPINDRKAHTVPSRSDDRTNGDAGAARFSFAPPSAPVSLPEAHLDDSDLIEVTPFDVPPQLNVPPHNNADCH